MADTDRELLELAAKAVGFKVKKFTSHAVPAAILVGGGMFDPLSSSGDALRLAVMLRLSVCVEQDQTWIAAHGHPTKPLCFVNHNGAPYTSTCRAIVMAAAEIGRAM